VVAKFGLVCGVEENQRLGWLVVTPCIAAGYKIAVRSDELINKLHVQSVLRSAARLVLRKRKFDHMTDDLRDQLHWLPIPQRIQYKLGLLVCTNVYVVMLHHTLFIWSHQSVKAPNVYDRPHMEILLFFQHGQFAWVHGALLSLAQHYGTRCQ